MNMEYNRITSNSNNIIISDVCRVCLSSNKTNKCIYLINITCDVDNSRIELRKLLELYGGIELYKDDGLPGNICEECILKIHTAYKLWKQCQVTDQKLRAIYKKPERNRLVFNSRHVTDQSCQTDDNSLLLPVNEENNIYSDHQESSSSNRKKLSLNILKAENTSEKNDNFNCKKDHGSNRPRRLSVFKRVTSIEHLKHHKERQRNYMKCNKNVLLKSDNANDEDNSMDSTIIDNDDHERLSNSVLSQKYQCSQCNEKYPSKKSLFLHYLTHNNNRDKLISIDCIVCRKVFKKTQTMIRHLNIHKKTNPLDVYNILKDIRCKREIETSLNNKLIINNPLKNNKNIIDDKINDKVDDFIDPEKPFDTKVVIKFINTWIKELLDDNKKNKQHCCSTCGKFYVTKKLLLKHNLDEHNNSKKVNEKIKTDTLKDNNEMKVCDKLNQYQCNKCNKIFDKKLQLQKHMRIHNDDKTLIDSDSNFKRFLCHICSKTFRQNTGLMFHMRTHTGYKPHVCKYCGRGFTSNSNCINHERTHTGDRPFICHYCSAAFAKSCTLKSHITTHTGEANYHCKTCGKSFKRLKYLKEHKFTHTGEKPYACKICGTAYSHSGSLFVHEKKCKVQSNNYQSTTTNESQSRYYCYSQQNINTNSTIMTLNNPPNTSSNNKNCIINLHNTNNVSAISNIINDQSVANNSINISSTVESLSVSHQIFNS